MSDDSEHPQPQPVPSIQLEYYRPDDPPLTHPLLLTVALLLGIVIATPMVAGCVGMVAIGVIDGGMPTSHGSIKHLIFYTLWLSLLTAELLAVVNWFKEYRQLPLQRRRMGSEYLMLGALIGALFGTVLVLTIDIFDA